MSFICLKNNVFLLRSLRRQISMKFSSPSNYRVQVRIKKPTKIFIYIYIFWYLWITMNPLNSKGVFCLLFPHSDCLTFTAHAQRCTCRVRRQKVVFTFICWGGESFSSALTFSLSFRRASGILCCRCGSQLGSSMQLRECRNLKPPVHILCTPRVDWNHTHLTFMSQGAF